MNTLSTLSIGWIAAGCIALFAVFGFVIMPLVHGYKHLRKSIILILPRVFSMRHGHLKDTVPLLRRIVTARSKAISLDMSPVEEITGEAYMVLLAQIEKACYLAKKKQVEIYTAPDQPIIPIDAAALADYDTGHCGKAVRRNQVDVQLASELVSELEKIGIQEFYPPFYDFLVELMSNATEHGIQHQGLHWWLLRYHDYDHHCMRYALVDMGQGIVESYRRAKLLKNNSEVYIRRLLIELMYGRMGSVTKEEGRGGGYTRIREAVEQGIVSDFYLLSNRVWLRYGYQEFSVGKSPNFVGTYVSWTVAEKNFYAWKRRQQHSK